MSTCRVQAKAKVIDDAPNTNSVKDGVSSWSRLGKNVRRKSPAQDQGTGVSLQTLSAAAGQEPFLGL